MRKNNKIKMPYLRRILKFSLLILLIMAVSACTEKDDPVPYELNVTMKNLEGVGPGDNNFEVVYYPHPFTTSLIISMNVSENGSLKITNDHGGWKEFSFDSGSQQIQLDFSAEKQGIYYLEVKSGNNVFRTYLLKQ